MLLQSCNFHNQIYLPSSSQREGKRGLDELVPTGKCLKTIYSSWKDKMSVGFVLQTDFPVSFIGLFLKPSAVLGLIFAQADEGQPYPVGSFTPHEGTTTWHTAPKPLHCMLLPVLISRKAAWHHFHPFSSFSLLTSSPLWTGVDGGLYRGRVGVLQARIHGRSRGTVQTVREGDFFFLSFGDLAEEGMGVWWTTDQSQVRAGM